MKRNKKANKHCRDCDTLIVFNNNVGLCRSCSTLGERHPLFKSGITKYGYKRATINGKRGQEHRRIIEEFIGRSLKRNEHVHHKDGNKINNSIDNLEILTATEHARLHTKEKWTENGVLRKLYANSNSI